MANSAAMRRVASKEIDLFFASPVAWLFLVAFAGATLFIFFWVETFFARNIADVRPMFEWMPLLLLFLCSALTMRMWSEERRSGTLEHVLTQPVSLWEFALGKLIACFTLLVLALLTTVPIPITVALLANLDWGPVVGAYLATLLLGVAYLSVGLCVSARTSNPIVSLIVSVALCSALYLLGSTVVIDLFDNRVAVVLSKLGTGSRFDSITRGVLDVRDLYYYLSLAAVFITLNVFLLEKERWTSGVKTVRHRRWRRVTLLLVLNFLLANVWLDRITGLRVDLSEGELYSLSTPSLALLSELQEPLLIRGYFSAKTHPLLAPLVPQISDLLREYEVAGKGRIRVEIVDPAMRPELEQEANERYNINATPFQISDRYQSALVNSYFNLLIEYGDEYETLGFSDLIEVHTTPNSAPEVFLRNGESDISRAIRNVLHSYQAGGDLFASIGEPLEFVAYISSDDLLPEVLLKYRDGIRSHLQQVAQASAGKFRVRFIEPEANDGALALQIAQEWGFKPMVATLEDDREFYFYLTLADDRQVVQLPTDNFDTENFPAMLDAGLKRFSSGFTKTVSLALPAFHEQMVRHRLGAPTFTNLERMITRDYSIRMENLDDGSVDPEADILAVIAPHQLSDRAVFAIDQYLMRGGTVILATSPFTAELAGGELRIQPWESGLVDWLNHHGIGIDRSFVLDEQNAPFPTPVIRKVGGYEFRDAQLVDYPYFIDIRAPGLNQQHPATSNIPQLTLAWASPMELQRGSGLRITNLLRSSPKSWRSKTMAVMPTVNSSGKSKVQSTGKQQSEELAVIAQGQFMSFFTGKADLLAAAQPRERVGVSALLEQSPRSARMVIFSSNDFMDDQMLSAIVAGSGNQYLGPLELFMNTLDWSLQDDALLQIRSRGNFNRTLPPMDRQAQTLIEYFNYGAAIILVAVFAFIFWLRSRQRKSYYRKSLAR
jgi:ABC-2 type transport system permease protein